MASKIYSISICFVLFLCVSAQAQTTTDTTGPFKPHGNLWGYTFGDYVFKGSADTVGSGLGRGNNQYSKMPAGTRMFQFRRIYLGYNYDISPRLSAEVLLAAEDDNSTASIGSQSSPGDVLTDNKFAPYVKLADVRWKNVFKGSDLVMGQMYTPSFAMLTEVVWGYRSIERTVSDMRRTNSFDEGVSLQGHYGKNDNFGYDVMVGNDNGAKPAVNDFQMFYGDVWAKFLDKKLIVDLYQDYAKLDWNAPHDTINGSFHHDRNMTKIFVAYTVPKFTVGIEAFQCTLLGDVVGSTNTLKNYYLTTKAQAISLYARGRIYKDKWGFFARYDNYNPGKNVKAITDNPQIINYSATSSAYDPTTKEQFITLGFDFTPFANLHLMPNVYINTYQCTLPTAYQNSDYSSKASGVKGTDAAYRLTIYYIFGKKDPIRF